MDTFRAMGVVHRRQMSRGVLYRLARASEPKQQSSVNEESESGSETYSSPLVTNPLPSKASSSRDRFSALKRGVGEIIAE